MTTSSRSGPGRGAVVRGTAGVAALAAAFAVGAVAGGGGTPEDGAASASTRPAGGPPAVAADDELALVNADLERPRSCVELLEWYVDRGIELVGPYGWDGGRWGYTELAFQRSAARDTAVSGSLPLSSSAKTSRVTTTDTGTNVQELGVDEPDVVKTGDGVLFRIKDDELSTWDVTGAEPERLATLDVGDVRDGEILLVGDRVVALGADRVDRHTHTRMVTLDVGDPVDPVVVDTQLFDSTLVEARLHGDVVRVVLAAGLPELDFVRPSRKLPWRRAREQNREVVRSSTIEDWLPTVASFGDETDTDTEDVAAEPLLDCSDVAIPDDDGGGLGTVSVVGVHPSTPAERTVGAVATASQTAYFSSDRFYLASGPTTWGWGWDCWDCGDRIAPGFADEDGTTDLYAFELGGTRTRYVASGEVEGSIADRWSMDSAGGVLRVAVGPSQDTGDWNSVVLLREDGSDLVESGRVDKLGRGEDIKAVRWFDELALVVTFRQVDPLYAIDLSDPDRPRLIGELKIPGFSEYLHPLGERRLVGMGQDASLRGMSRGAQAALFDVTDLTDPRRISTVQYPRHTVAGAAADPRQFTWLPDRRTVLTVISKGWRGRTGWVSVLTLGGGRMDNRMVEVEHGSEVDEVRLVPLPTGRVVLVTGDDVRFFDLD